jgi:hypothetical protein
MGLVGLFIGLLSINGMAEDPVIITQPFAVDLDNVNTNYYGGAYTILGLRVMGGTNTLATGYAASAGGEGAFATHDNTFVWSDGTLFGSTIPYQFSAFASNGFRLMGGPIFGNGSGLTNLNVIGSLPSSSITSDKLASSAVLATHLAPNSVGTSAIVTGAVTSVQLADNSIGTNKATMAEWNQWGDARFISQTGTTDISMSPGRLVAGYGLNLTNIYSTAYGASQRGANTGKQTIGASAYGALQQGYNRGVQTVGVSAYGALQMGYNTGTQTLTTAAYGAMQRGYNTGSQFIGLAGRGASQQGFNTGTQTIGNGSAGASQSGYNRGTQAVGANSHGAEQRGYVAQYAVATNNGIGSIQLLNLASNQTALITGHASIGLGACTVTNDQAIVAGDGLVSHGNGTVTARGFYGDGFGLTNLNLAAALAASSVNLGTNSMTAGSFNGDGSGLTGIASATTVTGAQSNTIGTVDIITDALGKMLTVRGFLTNDITSSQPYSIDIPTHMPVMYAAVATGSDANDGLTWGTAKQSIQAAIDVIGTNGVIYVDAGVYTPITVLSNREVYVVSVFGPSVTSINGQGTNRCATLYRDFTNGGMLYTNAALIGFTLTNGIISPGYPDLPYDGDWGGAVCGGRVYNSIITGCGASRAVVSVTLANRTYFENCLIYSNNINAYTSAYFMLNCVLVNSVVANNITSGDFSKTLAGGYIYNSIIKNNVCGSSSKAFYVDFYRSVSDITGTSSTFNDGSLLNSGAPVVFTNGYWLADNSPYIAFGNSAYVTTATDLARGSRKLLEGNSCSIGCYEGPYRATMRSYIEDPNMTALDRLLRSYERGITSVSNCVVVAEARLSTNDRQINSVSNRVSGIESRTNAYETMVTRAATALQPESITNLVPYTGAAGSVNLGTNSITAQLFIGDGSGLTNLPVAAALAANSVTTETISDGSVSVVKLSMDASLNMNQYRVTNMGNPVNNGDAVTKSYLRAVLSALPPQGDLSMGSFTNGAPASFPLSF